MGEHNFVRDVAINPFRHAISEGLQADVVVEFFYDSICIIQRVVNTSMQLLNALYEVDYFGPFISYCMEDCLLNRWLKVIKELLNCC